MKSTMIFAALLATALTVGCGEKSDNTQASGKASAQQSADMIAKLHNAVDKSDWGDRKMDVAAAIEKTFQDSRPLVVKGLFLQNPTSRVDPAVEVTADCIPAIDLFETAYRMHDKDTRGTTVYAARKNVAGEGWGRVLGKYRKGHKIAEFEPTLVKLGMTPADLTKKEEKIAYDGDRKKPVVVFAGSPEYAAALVQLEKDVAAKQLELDTLKEQLGIKYEPDAAIERSNELVKEYNAKNRQLTNEINDFFRTARFKSQEDADAAHAEKLAERDAILAEMAKEIEYLRDLYGARDAIGEPTVEPRKELKAMQAGLEAMRASL